MEETIRQIQNAHQGDKAARDRLVTENTGLVWSIVRRFAGRGYELEDLFPWWAFWICLMVSSMGVTCRYIFSW